MLPIFERTAIALAWLSMAFLCLLIFHIDFGQKTCFIAMENGEIIYEKGICRIRKSPYCSFNYLLSLASYDMGILKDAHNPVLPYKSNYVAHFDSWRQDLDPQEWRKTSCVWYSQVLSKKMGLEALSRYVDMMDYGNHDLSGDFNKDNGLVQSWMESSLEISAYEQVVFLDRMLKRDFPISDHAYDMTTQIFYNKILKNDWKLYGKKGSGHRLSEDRKSKLESQAGLFVGWIEKGERQILFVSFIEDGNQYYNEYVFNRAYQYALKSLGLILQKDNA
jgi:beta-lactamase class D